MPISLQAFTGYMQKYGLIAEGQKILLAFSGGVDSVVLATLLKEAGYTLALAHCNFSLRDKESDGDEDFARNFAQQQNIPFYTIRFNTLQYARQHKVSTQVAARELRYNWFYELMESEGYNQLATAHHQTDQVETMLLNMVRGTGLSGVQAMQPKDGNLIRPLLTFTRADIEAFAKAKKLKWREDSSNKSNKYSRNKVRNVVLPVLKGLNPKYEENFSQLSQLVGEYRALLNDTIAANTKAITTQQADTLKINKQGLLALPYMHLYLYELLKPYGFNSETIQQLISNLSAQSGALFYGEQGEALIDREEIIVRKKQNEAAGFVFNLPITAEGFTFAGKKYTIERVSGTDYEILKDAAIAQLDADKLQFPLQVRSWQQGDYFYPLGMRKKKKVSDFFVDQKIPVFNKQEYPLLFSGEYLVCIAGLRVDDRFKVTSSTQNIIIIKEVK